MEQPVYIYIYIATVLASTSNLHRLISAILRLSKVNGIAELKCRKIDNSIDERQVRESVPFWSR